jgi:hypothetical protein
MQSSTPHGRFLWHAVAIVGSTGFFTVFPILLYVALVVWTEDIGGPLNFIIIPVASIAIGLTISLAALLPLSLLAERFHLKRWLLLSGVSSAVLTGIVVPAWIYMGITKAQSHSLTLFSIGSGLCLYLVSGFFIYLCWLTLCRRVFP